VAAPAPAPPRLVTSVADRPVAVDATAGGGGGGLTPLLILPAVALLLPLLALPFLGQRR
jgi:hypothetical protein